MSVTYSNHTLGDLEVKTTETVSTNNRTTKNTTIIVDGQALVPTQRFWNSIGSRFGLSTRLFGYFTPEEVLKRVTEVSKVRNKSIDIRLAAKDGELLAVSDPKANILKHDDLYEFLEKNGAYDIKYNDGVLTAMFIPNGGNQLFNIGPDAFGHRFMASLPIDGYGNYMNALALWRQICSNGAVALTPVFQSNLKIGQEDMMRSLTRAISSFSNDDGYTVLENRILVSQSSMASVSEVVKARSTLEKKDGFAALRKLSDLTGNLNYMYGTSNLTTLGKKQKMLPSKCTMYDLINFMTEYSTHHNTDARHSVGGLVGSYLSTEFDLENTKVKAEDFEGMFLKDEKLLDMDFTEGEMAEDEENEEEIA
jgi:hypothetical protein